MDPDRTRRRQIFAALTSWFGKILPATFIRDPELPGVERIHPLIEGIYKPAWSTYALSIASMLKSPYSDQTHFNPDRTWWMHYSPKAGGMDLAANTAMIRCMDAAEPLLVLKQISAKDSRSGAQHRLFGLGLVESFDHAQQLFTIRGIHGDQIPDHIDTPLTDDLLETVVRLESLEQWEPFVKEERVLYRVNPQKRDKAFRDVVLDNYNQTCAVTGQKFVYSVTVEADAAHIIAKGVRGTDDPRNGLALSRSVHWAFDQGIFTLSDQYEVIIHPAARQASSHAFPLLEMERKRILLPSDSAYLPHPEALDWHRSQRFGIFAQSPSTPLAFNQKPDNLVS
jgi:hypothetical protein